MSRLFSNHGHTDTGNNSLDAKSNALSPQDSTNIDMIRSASTANHHMEEHRISTDILTPSPKDSAREIPLPIYQQDSTKPDMAIFMEGVTGVYKKYTQALQEQEGIIKENLQNLYNIQDIEIQIEDLLAKSEGIYTEFNNWNNNEGAQYSRLRSFLANTINERLDQFETTINQLQPGNEQYNDLIDNYKNMIIDADNNLATPRDLLHSHQQDLAECLDHLKNSDNGTTITTILNTTQSSLQGISQIHQQERGLQQRYQHFFNSTDTQTAFTTLQEASKRFFTQYQSIQEMGNTTIEEAQRQKERYDQWLEDTQDSISSQIKDLEDSSSHYPYHQFFPVEYCYRLTDNVKPGIENNLQNTCLVSCLRMCLRDKGFETDEAEVTKKVLYNKDIGTQIKNMHKILDVYNLKVDEKEVMTFRQIEQCLAQGNPIIFYSIDTEANHTFVVDRALTENPGTPEQSRTITIRDPYYPGSPTLVLPYEVIRACTSGYFVIS